MSLLGFIHHVKILGMVKILGLNNVMCIFKNSQVGKKGVKNV